MINILYPPGDYKDSQGQECKILDFHGTMRWVWYIDSNIYVSMTVNDCQAAKLCEYDALGMVKMVVG